MFGHKKPEVLVVGAGPVGLFAALWLLKRGVRPRIIDMEEGRTTRSYALALHAETMELMTQLGLEAEVLRHALRVDHVGVFDGDAERARIDLSTLPSAFPFITILPQSRLEELLINALHERGVSVEWDRRLARMTQHADHVTATVEKLAKDSMGYAISHTEMVVIGDRDMDVKFVLAADGHNSVVRRQLGIDFPSVRQPLYMGVLEFTPTAAPTHPRVVLDAHTTNVLWPLPGERYRWSVQMPNDAVHAMLPSGKVFSRDKDRLFLRLGSQDYLPIEVEQLDEWIAQRAPWFEKERRQTHWHFAVRFEHRHAERFGDRRVWLAGDAGHLTGPVGGQSMNVGMREAATLADVYANILHDNAPMSALKTYNEQRVTEWSHLLGQAGKPKPLSDKTDPWIARRAAKLLPCIPASGAHLKFLLGQLGLSAPV